METVVLGGHLVAALVAGLLGWLVLYLCGKAAFPSWITTTLSYATLVYFFWLFTSIGPITIGK